MALQTKTVTERILFTVDFQDELPETEVVSAFITSVNVRIYVFTGIDPAPQEMFWKIQDIEGLTVFVQVQGGLPGVIYVVAIDVTIGGDPYTKEVKLAVLPDTALLPPTAAIWLTSRPYPAFMLEGYEGSSQIVGGDLNQLIFSTLMGPEGIDGSSRFVDGILRDLLVNYVIPPEGIDGSSQLVTGEVRQLLFSYTVPPEGIDGFSILTTGSLENKLLTTIIAPEGINGSSQIAGGSLT